MSRYNGYIQPIVIRKSGSHEEMVEAAARASVAAWLSDPDNPAWEPWLAASFGKTVRRARPVEVEKAREFYVASAKVGQAEAFACLPVLTDELPDPIRRLQVTGTDADRTGWVLPADQSDGPQVAVNAGAGMSTGKTCAQVAHGVFGWALRQTSDRLAQWQEAGLPFYPRDLSGDRFVELLGRARVTPNAVVIEDAGHTEVEPGTATVVAWS